ncbi:hypothetical protein T472_0205375 [Youngiibacter fragilis 232.1]|uniref:Uncharacterized protein n=1 Tax=Youngiibacter fragilis 232.1 TaxID=994573 RepID=V7I8R5_9CLOT|nr:hypothetical protein T472_0205375 [Youngiibacter fragilis 232.1]
MLVKALAGMAQHVPEDFMAKVILQKKKILAIHGG